MAWPEGSPEDAGLQAEAEHDYGTEGSVGPPPEPPLGDPGSGEEKSEDLLSEVNAVAQHLRELQTRLGTYRRRGEETAPPPGTREEPPVNGTPQRPEEASEHVAAIIAAAEAAAAEIRARAEASAGEIVANAESAAARIREEARLDERRLFEAIDALRPAAAGFQHALERVNDAAVAALMSYPRD